MALPENIFSKDEMLKDFPSFSTSIEQVKPELKSTFDKPTKQWVNRCYGVQESSQQIYNNIETIDKL